MIFVLALFVVVGLFLAVVPAAALGLTVGLVSARLALRWRILLILGASGVAVAGWAALIRNSYVLAVFATLAGAAVLFAGGLPLLWSATHRRPATAWQYRATHLLQP